VQFRDNGMLSLIGSHARVKAPWVQPCGLLDAKEFVLAADRLVLPRGQVVPGAGAAVGAGSGGMQAAAHRALAYRLRCLGRECWAQTLHIG